jgi:hypothetical protein
MSGQYLNEMAKGTVLPLPSRYAESRKTPGFEVVASPRLGTDQSLASGIVWGRVDDVGGDDSVHVSVVGFEHVLDML